MLSPNTLNRVSSSYRRGYYDGYDKLPAKNISVEKTDMGIPMKPFSDSDYESGHAAGLNDRYWRDHRAGTEQRSRAEFLAAHSSTRS